MESSRARPQPVPSRPVTDPSSPSNALTTNSAIPSDSTTIELARRLENAEAELDRIRLAASLDVQNLQNDIVAKNREIGRLKADLAKAEQDEPEHDDTHQLLMLWKALTHRNGKTDIKPGGKRYKLVKAAVKRWGHDRCEHAIRGLALKPYSGPRGRSHEQYLGAKKVADIEHALGDEVRFERCEQYWLEHLEPSLLDQPSEPVPPLAAVPAAEGPDTLDPPPGLLKLTPTKGRPAGYWHGGWRGDNTPPITKMLASLHERSCVVKPNPSNPDRWAAQCPAHEDRSPSLSIERKPDGMLLVHCFAGCDIGDIMAALNLDVRELWAGADRDYERADGGPRKHVVPAHLRHAMRQLLEREEAA